MKPNLIIITSEDEVVTNYSRPAYLLHKDWKRSFRRIQRIMADADVIRLLPEQEETINVSKELKDKKNTWTPTHQKKK